MADHRRIKGRICNRVRNYFRISQSTRFRIRPKLDPQHRRVPLQVETVSSGTSAFDSDEVSDDEEPVPVVSLVPGHFSSIDQVRWIFSMYFSCYYTSSDAIIFAYQPVFRIHNPMNITVFIGSGSILFGEFKSLVSGSKLFREKVCRPGYWQLGSILFGESVVGIQW